jgi:hypothetical protein
MYSVTPSTSCLQSVKDNAGEQQTGKNLETRVYEVGLTQI